MKIAKLILTLTGIITGASLASAAINIDAKAYHEQRQAEKRARLEAEKNKPAPSILITPAKIEQKSKTNTKAETDKKVEPVIIPPLVVTPEEKIEQPAKIKPEINATINAAGEQLPNVTLNAERTTPPGQL
jgi:hypothetical protein